MSDSPAEGDANLPSSDRVLAALRQARERLEAAERKQSEPIAIVGVGCRFPGGDGAESFWELLRDGVDATGEMPTDRRELHAPSGSDGLPGDSAKSRWGAFLDQVDLFDADFFGISPREAVSLDPQQRLLLEVAWQALEHAGQAPDLLAGSRSGVFMGVSQNDYALLQLQQRDPKNMDFYVGTGGGLCYGPGRLAHMLGLRGPNMAVDTACSSSLMAIHLACQSLRSGECDLALAGGVHLALSPHLWDLLADSGALSPDGRCKAFAEDANGFGRGEGCGVIVLRRLSNAIDRRDRILATIRGSAVNHDGRSSGLTVPNETSQEELLQLALDAARVQPTDVDYVEAHGTGTSLGDPIEVEALANVLGVGREADKPLLIGSVKSNFGHLEAAAGVAGLIKVVLALANQQIPRHLHFRSPSPHIPWDEIPIAVAAEAVPWQRSERVRIAGVSSFGMSGANAHVVIEEAPAEPLEQGPLDSRPQLIALSAQTPKALAQLAGRFDQWLAGDPSADLADVAFTANAGRAHFDVRTSVVADSTETARQAFAAIHSGKRGFSKVDTDSAAPKIALLFTGQGSQYAQMGRRLYETQPSFRRVIDRCDALFQAATGASLLEVLMDPADKQAELIHQTNFTQPALFAVEYALADLLRGWGIRPGAVMGHSIGEYVAAATAGVLTVENGFKLVTERARLMQGVAEVGEMAVVFADERRVRQALEPLQDEVSIAAINAPGNIVISGRPAAVETLIAGFEKEGIGAQRLDVSQAFHSPLIEPALAPLEKFAAGLRFNEPAIDLVSNVTGRLATTEITQPGYWSRHARQPVLCAEGFEALYQRGYRIFVECGPKPTLCALARRCLPDDAVLLPCLSDKRDDWQQLQETVGQLYERGVEIDWEAFHRDDAPRRISLPTYPFQRERYWFEADRVEAGRVKSVHAQAENGAVDLERSPAEDDDCRYQLAWRPCDPAQPVDGSDDFGDAMRAGDRWLILADRSGVANWIQELLKANQQECVLVYRGEQFEHSAETPEQWTLNPTRAEDFRRLLDDCAATDSAPLRAVLHLWSLDSPLANGLTASALDSAQEIGFASGMHLAQALAEKATATQMWLVTQQVVSIAEADASTEGLAQSPLWGLGKVIALEQPDLWGGLIDLPAEVDDSSLKILLKQVGAAGDEDQVAIRHRQRYVARICRQEKSRPPAPDRGIRADDSTYLITGGLGTLGLHLARWFVDQGARNLVLVGRSDPGAEAKAAVQELEQGGAQITIFSADVASEEDVAKVMQTVHSALPPLRGVIHAAGAFGYRNLAELDWETARDVLRAKVRGTWVLHQATSHLELDFFGCFSSLASLWGAQGQAHYAAANGFLDAFAHWRHDVGLTCLSVNWGPWSGGGMVTDEALASLERNGLRSFSAERSLGLFGDALGSGVAQIALADIDWRVLKTLFEVKGRRPIFDEIAPQSNAESGLTTEQATESTEILRRLEDLSPDQYRAELSFWIQQEAASVLRLEEGKLPDPDKGFFHMGMDSLMAVELVTQLKAGLRLPLPATLAFDFPTVSEVAEHLANQLQGGTGERLPVIKDPVEDVDDDPDVSAEDLERMLAERLARLESLTNDN